MPYIQRELQPQITRETPPKAVVIFGARQIGKTTLLTELSQYEKSVRWFNGDLITDHRQLQFSSSTDVELTLRQADTIIIDEAQRFPNIGLILKQLVDVNVRLNLGKKIFATGSSSLEGSSSKALFNFALRELLSIKQAKFLCKRLFRVLLKSFLKSFCLIVGVRRQCRASFRSVRHHTSMCWSRPLPQTEVSVTSFHKKW